MTELTRFGALLSCLAGRRRLCKRVDDSDDEDEDEDFGFTRKSPPVVKKAAAAAPIELESSSEDEEEQEVPEVKAKPKSPVKSPKKAKQQPKKEEEVKAKPELSTEEEVVEVDEEEASQPKEEVKETPKEKKPEAKGSPKTTKPQSNGGGFFTTRSDKSPKKSSSKEHSDDVKADKKADEATSATSAADEADENADEGSSTIAYSALAHLFNTIEATSSRLVIQDLLLKFFRDVLRRAPQDLLACIYLCVCTDLAPPFENLKIGIGDAILMKAIGEATGTNPKFIKDMYQKEGDLGKVAQNARSKQHTLSFASTKPATTKPSVLGVQDVYSQFVKIAKMTGNNSQAQKCSIIKSLLVKCEKDRKNSSSPSAAAEGAKYIIRGLQGKLRIGLAEKSILIGLTYAFMLEKDQSEKDKQQEALVSVKKAFAECPSYNALVDAFQQVQQETPTSPLLRVKDFAKVAERCVLTPGTPVSPMLARPTKAYTMVFDRFQGMPFTCEYKYDGERAQIHILPNGEIAIFSRNFENSTERFPDVKFMIAKAAKRNNVKSCIVDAEVVAVDKATNKRLPFQILSTRSRKNVKVEDIKVPVCIYAFDLLFLDGESYLPKPLAERRSKLKEIFELEDGSFELASSIDVEATEGIKDDADAMEVAVDKVRTFLEEAVREQCEGLMVKTLEKEATYEPANRSHKWLKLKKDYLDGIGDSTDLVPIGAFFGRGKRTGVYGAYLLACYDPDTDMYQPITKLGTGLSDEVLKQFYGQLKEKVVDKMPRDYAVGDGAIKPDVWFEPTCVWEILGADLSISPKYTAGMGLVARDKGISLRFPRFIRIRDDKNTTQATTSTQVRQSVCCRLLSSYNTDLVCGLLCAYVDCRSVSCAGPRDRERRRRRRR